MRHGRAWLWTVLLPLLMPAASLRAESNEERAADGEQVNLRAYPVADLALPVARGNDGQPLPPDYESLVDLIELRTGADCWTDGGGKGFIDVHEPSKMLLVRQTPAVHQLVADLLNELRSTLDLAMQVEIQLLSGDLSACGKETEFGSSPLGLMDEEARQNLLELAQSQPSVNLLCAPKVTTFNGQPARVSVEGQFQVDVNAVASGDHRYARVWLNFEADGRSTASELLIPDGCTSVRELEPGKTWMLVTAHVMHTREPQEVEALPSLESPSRERFLVPSDNSEVSPELTRQVPMRIPVPVLLHSEKVALKPLDLPKEADAVVELATPASFDEPKRVAVASLVDSAVPQNRNEVHGFRIAPIYPSTDPLSDAPSTPSVLHVVDPEVRDPLPRGAVGNGQIIFRLIRPSSDGDWLSEEDAPAPLPPLPATAVIPAPSVPTLSLLPPESLPVAVFAHGFAEECLFPPKPHKVATKVVNEYGIGVIPASSQCDGSCSQRSEALVQQVSAEVPATERKDPFEAAAEELELAGMEKEANTVREFAARRARLRELDQEIARMQAERDQLQQAEAN